MTNEWLREVMETPLTPPLRDVRNMAREILALRAVVEVLRSELQRARGVK